MERQGVSCSVNASDTSETTLFRLQIHLIQMATGATNSEANQDIIATNKHTYTGQEPQFIDISTETS